MDDICQERYNCIICKNKLNNIYEFPNFPICMFSTELPTFINKNLIFSCCENCNEIQLKILINPIILYSNSHNTEILGETWRNHFEQLYKFISRNINISLNNIDFLEIGDPIGKLVKYFIDDCKSYTIIDPNAKDNNSSNKIKIISDFIENVDVKANVILHSHFFEHLYNPMKFLEKMFNMLNYGDCMIFSIPDMEFQKENDLLPFLGMHFEHTYYINVKILEYMLNKKSFKITDKYNFISNGISHSVFISCVKEKNITMSELFKLDKSIIPDLEKTIEKYKLKINEWNKYDNFYVFGSIHSTQYLIFLGLNTDKIICILDNSKEKENKYLYGTNLIVRNPQIMKNDNNPIVICCLVYKPEIEKQLMEINGNVVVL